MPKKISIEIEERVDFLEKQYAKAKGRLQKERIQTLLYVKTQKYCYQSDIGRKLGRS